MKAVYIRNFSPEFDVEVREVSDARKPASDEITVKVSAAGVNRADLLQARGLYPPPQGISPEIPGLEFAGEVVAIGTDVTGMKVGDRVFGITAGESQAEYVTVNSSHVCIVPDGIDLVEAAAFPEAFVTAYDALVTIGGLRPGENVMIHAAGSGVGLAAVQIAKYAGCRVIGTSRTPDKLDRCREYGMDDAITVGKPAAFSKRVLELTNGRGVDVILDLVGAAYFGENLLSAADKGRVVLVGLTGGNRSEFDMGVALRKRLSITGTVLRSRNNDEKASAVAAFTHNVLPQIASGQFVPVIDRVFSANDAATAYRRVAANENFGKVILTFD